MPLDKEVLDLANDKKFTEFSKAVKHELKSKLSNNDLIKTYVSDFDKLQQMKKAFEKIHRKDQEDPEKLEDKNEE